MTLNPASLTTSIVATNDDAKPFDCQVLMHTYLRVKVLSPTRHPQPPSLSHNAGHTNTDFPVNVTQDITAVEIQGLASASYIDKVDGATTKTQSEPKVTITGETDRVYTPAAEGGDEPVTVVEAGAPRYAVTRDNLGNVVVWNPWTDKAAGMADFAPKDGFRQMVCVEPGAVGGWQTVEAGDAFEGAQTIALLG